MWAIFALIAGSAVFWLQYVDLKDRVQPEDRDRLIAAFVLGVLAAVGAMFAYAILEWVGLNVAPDPRPARLADHA